MKLSGPEGLLLIDKRAGATSHDLVAQVRRLTAQPRTGHAGTLDPFATGLLPMMLGRATRLIRFLPATPKRYEGTLVLGTTTATDDCTGETIATHDGALPDRKIVLEAATGLVGKILQVPPSFSAKKVEGKRLYRSAREGTMIQLAPVEVQVFEFSLTPDSEDHSYSFRASVGPGTYIRALARDLGEKLGCGGHLAALRRTAVGPLTVEGARFLERTDPGSAVASDLEEMIVPLDKIPLDLAPITLDDLAQAKLFLAGGRLVRNENLLSGTMARVEGPDGSFLGVGEFDNGVVRPRVVLS
jgi:tRNA pseudouridine55 synthase